METNPATEPREEFSFYDNPLVQLTLEVNTSFHFPTEGRPRSSEWIGNHPPDETTGEKYGPNAPFWRTSLGQTIAGYGIATTESEPDILTSLITRFQNTLSNK